jgi:hypothetical protein
MRRCHPEFILMAAATCKEASLRSVVHDPPPGADENGKYMRMLCDCPKAISLCYARPA